MSDDAITLACSLAKQFEGFRSHPYKDTGGKWTIGYGATYLQDGAVVTQLTAPISQEDALVLLDHQMTEVAHKVLSVVTKPLNANQLAALCDFTFNEGIGRLKMSTLLSLLNMGKYKEAADQLPRWVYGRDEKTGKEVVLSNQVRRRTAEQDLFLKPVA